MPASLSGIGRWRLALAGIALLAAGCFQAGDPTEVITVPPPTVQAGGFTLEHHHADLEGGRHLHWVAIGDRGAPAILFVHGSPGSWRAWRPWLAHPGLLAKARLLAVDRPGFGLSDPGRFEPSLAAQAHALLPALRAAQGPAGRRPVLAGHSYGGPLIARMALDYPEEVGGLLLIAPSIDPALERLRWFNHVASWRLVQWAINDDLLTSNREILPLRPELEAMDARWREIHVPVLVLQGEKDHLVPPANADYAERRLAHLEHLEILRIPGHGHFLLWEKPDLVTQALETLFERRGSP